MEKSISRALVTTVALLLFLRSSRVLDRGCHAFVVPQRTQRCSGKTGFSSTATTKPSGLGFGLSNPSSPSSSAAAAAPESAPSFFRSTSKTLIRSLESSSLSGDTGEGPLFASTSSPEATFESDSDLGDSSAALLLPSSDDEGLSPFLSMDQTRTIPALAEITMFPPAPTSSFVLVAQQPVSPPPPQELKLWQGRLLVVTCAAICGTNYPLIKILDNVGAIPTAAATALRFALAAVAVWAFVLAQEQRDKNDETKNPSPRRGPATWLGAEVGVYYGIAYIAQAMGLHTVDASKVKGQRSLLL